MQIFAILHGHFSRILRLAGLEIRNAEEAAHLWVIKALHSGREITSRRSKVREPQSRRRSAFI